MMKVRLLVLLLSLVLGGVAKAQDLRLGMQAGANAAFFTGAGETAPRMGAFGGVFGECQLGQSPWQLRLDAMLEYVQPSLRNFDLKDPTGAILRYDQGHTYLAIPLTLGYRIELNERLSLTPRLGIYYRYGLGSDGEITTRVINPQNAEPDILTRVHPFDRIMGDANNTFESYHFAPYRSTHWGLTAGLTAQIGKRLQLTATYKHGTGKELVHTYDGLGRVRLSSFDIAFGWVLY